ncbi:MAG: methyltransferase domain-containing protein [Anaerolineales bacterium]|nr:methyltransferase domain-containing protein [Anaerolineales bacterium]
MSQRDAWSNPSQTSLEDVARMAEHLEERSQRPDQLQFIQAACRALKPQPGQRLLEAGCGTGFLCRLAAPYLAPGGSVTGLDISPQFIAIARQLAAGSAHADRIRFQAARAEAIPHPEACFDGAWAVRLLLHADDPGAVMREIARVVRPGGRIVLADWDFETTLVDHSDRELTRRLLNWRCDQHSGDNWSGRKLLAWAVNAGLREVSVTPLVVIAHDESAALTQTLWRAAEVARQGGAISPAEHDAWVGELKRRIAAGRFFASMTYFIVNGWK